MVIICSSMPLTPQPLHLPTPSRNSLLFSHVQTLTKYGIGVLAPFRGPAGFDPPCTHRPTPRTPQHLEASGRKVRLLGRELAACSRSHALQMKRRHVQDQLGTGTREQKHGPTAVSTRATTSHTQYRQASHTGIRDDKREAGRAESFFLWYSRDCFFLSEPTSRCLPVHERGACHNHRPPKETDGRAHVHRHKPAKPTTRRDTTANGEDARRIGHGPDETRRATHQRDERNANQRRRWEQTAAHTAQRPKPCAHRRNQLKIRM